MRHTARDILRGDRSDDDAPASGQHPEGLYDRSVGMPELMQHKGQQHAVEGAIGDRQRFGIPNLPLDRASRRRRLIAGERNEAFRVVDPRDDSRCDFRDRARETPFRSRRPEPACQSRSDRAR